MMPRTHTFGLRGLGAACAAVLTLYSGACCLAQSVWELTPYRIVVYLAVDDAGGGEALAARVGDRLKSQSEFVVGAAWQLEVRDAPAELRSQLLDAVDLSAAEDGAHAWATDGVDKYIFITIMRAACGVRIAAQEWDANTRIWSTRRAVDAPQRELVGDAAFRLALDVFSPLARIETVEEQSAVLRLRASAFSPRDASLVFLREGDLFRPVLRHNDSRGNLRGLQSIPWTLLTVASVDSSTVTARLHTGLRTPLSTRLRGRIEQLALAVEPAGGGTRLLLRSRSDVDRALSGYEILAQDEGQAGATRLGRTDATGAIDVPASAARVRTLFVKSGDEVVARLPMAPGLEPEMTAELVDDRSRLAAEALIHGWQENFVDMVARRRVLEARIQTRLDDGDLAGAEKLLSELRSMSSPQELAVELRLVRQKLETDDPAVRIKVDKLFADTQELINRYLDYGALARLESAVAAAKRGSTAAVQ